jgi:hemerythrin superfamily protein
MTDTRIRIRKATRILKDDHEKVRGLFSEYGTLEEGSNAARMHLFMELKRELTIHGGIEEGIFYPAIQRREDVRDALEAHRIVRTLLQDLSSLTPEDDEFDLKIRALQEVVLRHAEQEERDLFPRFELLDPEEQDDLSEQLRLRKLDLMEKYE